MRRVRLVTVVLVLSALAVVPSLASAREAGSSAPAAAITQTHAASLAAVPKFIFHAGLAFGAFHHFIYLPFKAGKFTHGSFLSKLKTYAFAGGAALFVYHETKLALQDAQQNKVLKVLVTPLTAVVALFNTVVSKVKAHKLDSSTLSSAQTGVTAIESASKGGGSLIGETIPTAKQILTGSA